MDKFHLSVLSMAAVGSEPDGPIEFVVSPQSGPRVTVLCRLIVYRYLHRATERALDDIFLLLVMKVLSRYLYYRPRIEWIPFFIEHADPPPGRQKTRCLSV